MASKKKVNLVVVGGGRIGTIHMASILRCTRARLAYFVDVDETRRKEVEEMDDGVKTVATLEELFDDEEVKKGIDGVLICSPTAHHFSQVTLCINNLIPTFCEKPLSMDHRQIREAYALAEEKKVPLLCGYQRRHDPSYVQLEKAVEEGEIGEVRTIRSCSRDNPIPSLHFLRISGGIMHDCASHDIDLCRWMAQEDPCEVYAMGSAFHEGIKGLDDWDTVMITLKFPSGRLACIELNRHAPYGYDQRIEVMGSKGMLQVENKRPTTVVKSLASGISVDCNAYSFPQRYTEAYPLELEHFVDMITLNVPPKVTGEDCRRVAIIADAAHESGRSGLPVKISYD